MFIIMKVIVLIMQMGGFMLIWAELSAWQQVITLDLN